MKRSGTKMSNTRGLPPGDLLYVGEEREGEVRITVIDYDQDGFREKTVPSVEEVFPFKDSTTVSWINIDGIYDTEVIEKIGKHFGVHHLLLEDIANTEQRAKYEDFDSYFFLALKMFYPQSGERAIKSEQISIVCGENFVISFQERQGDVFGPIRERIRNGKGRVRKMGADYLAYSLVDAVVDGYFLILEKLGEEVEGVEETLLSDPSPETLKEIYSLKREVISLRKAVWPLREVINAMQRDGSDLIDEGTRVYLRDAYDHTIQVIDTVETLRDILSGILDIYLSSISNRMNEIMKVLTIIATIFIPLTFIAGVYGMNFEHMPELEWRFAYLAVWGVFLIVIISMVAYFKKKKWL